MDALQAERIAVVVGATTYGVTLTVGDTQICVRTPRSSTGAYNSEEQVRAAAIRSARRALEVALEELGLVHG